MSNAEQVSQALAELWDIVKCRCHEAYTGRGLHDPDCECDSTDALQIVTDRIEALTEQLAAARQDAKFAEDELELQEQEACMMENDYIKLEKERDALQSALGRIRSVPERILRGVPVCDLAETLAEADSALIKGEPP